VEHPRIGQTRARCAQGGRARVGRLSVGRTGGGVNFDGKKVLVTGGARGIGRATALAFATRGAKVAIGYRAGLAEAERTLASLPGDGHVAIAGDLTDADVARHVVEGAIEALGGLDVLVNSAGVGGHHRLDAVSYEEWQEIGRAHV